MGRKTERPDKKRKVDVSFQGSGLQQADKMHKKEAHRGETY